MNRKQSDLRTIIAGNRGIVIGTVVVLLVLICGLFAPWLSPHDPAQTDLNKRLIPPGQGYPFGTDHLGRCIFSRVLYGARVSLFIGISVIGISMALGTIIGSLSAYLGGAVDLIVMRFVDGVLAFPALFAALALIGVLGESISGLIIALSVLEWTPYARISRGSVLSIKNKEYIFTARMLGGKGPYLLTKHIFPNIVSPLFVVSTLGMGNVILAAAGLSFLGLGVTSMPEWGMMVSEGRVFLQSAPHIMLFPGLCIVITVLGFNFLGDGLRDYCDPRDIKQRWKVY